MKKNNFLNFILLFLLLFYSNLVFGQEDFKPGYIITNNRDTINGFINVKSNVINSRNCEFVTSLNGEIKKYGPSEIYAYRIKDDKFYISKDIVLNNKNEKLFLEFLVEGIISLYYLNNQTCEYYYIENKDTIVQLSNDKNEIINEYEVKYLVNSNQYKGALRYLFQNSPELYNKINNTPFSLKPLISITEDYHNSVCKDYKCINYKKNTKINVFIEPYLGIIHSKMKIKTSNDMQQI